jgi:PAS domain S-box-containing protein
VLLVQETEEDLQAGALMYVPVYKKNKPTKTVEECRAAIMGWVYSPYRMTDLMKGILGNRGTINADRIHLKIYDNDNLTEKSLLFDSQVKYTSEQAKQKYRKVIQSIVFNGKKWTLYFSQPYGLITPFSSRTLIVLIGGVLISFLLAFLSLSLLNSKFRQRIAEKLSSDLIKLNEELKQSKEKTEKIEALKRKMVANIGDVIVIIDHERINRYKSPNLEKLFGWKPEELVGNSIWDNVHPDDLDYAQRFIASLLSEPGKAGTTKMRYRHKDGHYSWIEFTGSNMLNDPDIKGLLGNYHDITERKKAEQALKESESKLRESNNTKDKFFSIIGHDLKSPFNSILGFSDILMENYNEYDEAKRYKIIKLINKSAVSAFRLVENLLTWSRSQLGHIKCLSEKVYVKIAILEIIQQLQAQADSKHISISDSASENDIIFVDKNMVATVLRNLIANAIKFTNNNGKINIASKKQTDSSFLEISVADTGVGIPKERIDDLFHIDKNISTKGTGNETGTGLGLIICKEFVEKQGGKIWIESEEGKGSIFYFTLPYHTEMIKGNSAENEILLPVEEVAINKLKILIVEDDESSEMLLSIAVQKFGEEIISVSTGTEAVAACLNKPDIDLVLMDIRMPEMDGYEATRQIRKFNKDVIIIAQTAYALAGDREKAIAAGCDDYITKPIKADELKQIIKKYLNKK